MAPYGQLLNPEIDPIHIFYLDVEDAVRWRLGVEFAG